MTSMEQADRTLTDDEIDTLLTALSMWESEFRCTGDDWSEEEALAAKLRAMKSGTDLSTAE